MILAITAGLWGGLFATSIMMGLVTQRFKTAVEQELSHVQIHHPEFLTDYNSKYMIDDWHGLKNNIKADEDAKAFSGRAFLSGMIGTATLTTGISILGVDPQMEANTTSLDQNIIDGQYFGEDMRNPVLIGMTLADKLKARPGTRVVLTFQDLENELTSASFRVAGIFQTANSIYDENNIFVLQKDVEEYLGRVDVINEVAVLLKELELADGFSNRYKEKYPELEVRTWLEISPLIGYYHEMGSTMLMVVLVIILLALAFGLLNTMLMSVYERIKELGMIMAIGMSKKRVFVMILLETVFLTLSGAVCGMIAGYSTVLLLKDRGLDLSVVGGDSLKDFGFDPVVYPHLDISFFAVLTVLVILLAVFTAVFPALKALRLSPAEAVKTE